MTQLWLLNHVPHHWSLDLWPSCSADCNPLDYFFWGAIDAKTNKQVHIKVDSLKAAFMEELATKDKNMVARACNAFCSCLEMVEAGGGYIEK